MDRRAFLKLGATGLLVGAGCASTATPEALVARPFQFGGTLGRGALAPREVAALVEQHADFPLGVMSGDATCDRAIVWTRYTGGGALVLWVKQRHADACTQLDVATGPDGFTHLDISGLQPGRSYRYAFLVRERGAITRRGPSGFFRTAIAEDSLEPVTFAGVSCTNQFIRPYPALAHAAARHDLDFFLHAGDHVYADVAVTLDEYRSVYAQAWPAYGMKALHAAFGLYATWDDHEVGNNWDPETWDRARVDAARRAYFEHHPIRRTPGDPRRLWRSFRWGRTLELFVLDSRGERRPSTRERADGQYISRPQMDWLKQGLATSQARFKAVLNSAPIANFPGLFGLMDGDRWSGFRAQREEILSFITRERIDGVWWLSGDFHFGCVGRVEPSGPYSAMREVLMGPGRQIINPLWSSLSGPQWDVLLGANNYTVLRADPLRDTMTVAFVGESGEMLSTRDFARVDAPCMARARPVRAL